MAKHFVEQLLSHDEEGNTLKWQLFEKSYRAASGIKAPPWDVEELTQQLKYFLMYVGTENYGMSLKDI